MKILKNIFIIVIMLHYFCPIFAMEDEKHLFEAIILKDQKTACQLLTQNNALISACNIVNETPLPNAAINGCSEVVCLLLDLGAKVNESLRYATTPFI